MSLTGRSIIADTFKPSRWCACRLLSAWSVFGMAEIVVMMVLALLKTACRVRRAGRDRQLSLRSAFNAVGT